MTHTIETCLASSTSSVWWVSVSSRCSLDTTTPCASRWRRRRSHIACPCFHDVFVCVCHPSALLQCNSTRLRFVVNVRRQICMGAQRPRTTSSGRSFTSVRNVDCRCVCNVLHLTALASFLCRYRPEDVAKLRELRSFYSKRKNRCIDIALGQAHSLFLMSECQCFPRTAHTTHARGGTPFV